VNVRDLDGAREFMSDRHLRLTNLIDQDGATASATAFLGCPSWYSSVPMARSGEARPDGRTRERCVNGWPAYNPRQMWPHVFCGDLQPFGQFSKNPRVSATKRRSPALQACRCQPAGYLISRISFSLFFAA
jgi:hypothetical protein